MAVSWKEALRRKWELEKKRRVLIRHNPKWLAAENEKQREWFAKNSEKCAVQEDKGSKPRSLLDTNSVL